MDLITPIRDIFTYDPDQPLIFTQALFWAFFAGIVLLYQFLHKTIRPRNIFLLGFSLFFYYKSGGLFFFLLLFSTIVDFVLALQIGKSKRQSLRKFYVAASLLINLGLLAYFKYASFFTEQINQLFGTSWVAIDYFAQWSNSFTGTNFDIGSIILPVGISFYTFQTISYTIDVYRRDIEPVRNILDFAFFVSFFPQLVAGPIVRASEFVPQIYKPYNLSKAEFGTAIFLIINGLAKKILISDYISANFVDRVFESPLNYSGFENLMGVYGYSIQIYCDFSGYTDIAIGVALLLGFRLTQNFNAPYMAVSITDFWRRWHISLSTWLRDYLYISLGGNRKGKVRQYVNLFITMLLGGLWHGAHLRFIIWGALHGLALAFHKLWMEITGSSATAGSWYSRITGRFITFHFVAFCWIFFRASDLLTVEQILTRIGTRFQPELIPQMLPAYAPVFGLILLGFLVHWLPQNWKLKVQEIFSATPDIGKAAIIALVVLGLYQVHTAGVQPFIYFQF